MTHPRRPDMNRTLIVCHIKTSDGPRFSIHPPELLALLKYAVLRVKLANEEGNPILSAWLPDAEAAIAKAEGTESQPETGQDRESYTDSQDRESYSDADGDPPSPPIPAGKRVFRVEKRSDSTINYEAEIIATDADEALSIARDGGGKWHCTGESEYDACDFVVFDGDDERLESEVDAGQCCPPHRRAK
jgi:hypothetical protein